MKTFQITQLDGTKSILKAKRFELCRDEAACFFDDEGQTIAFIAHIERIDMIDEEANRVPDLHVLNTCGHPAAVPPTVAGWPKVEPPDNVGSPF